MNNKFRFFLISISLAGLLWLINHFNQEYTVGVFLNINYEGFSSSEKKQAANTLYLEVNGRGFSLIQFYYKQPYTINLSKSDFKSVKRGDTTYLRIIPDVLNKSVANVLPAGISIKNIPNDTLTVSYVSYPSKEVPVKIKYNLINEKNCIVSGQIKVIPPTIRITGPSEIISLVDSVETIPITFRDACDTIQATFKLVSFKNQKISSNVSEVHVLIPIQLVVQHQSKLHYNISVAGHNYDGEIDVVYAAPSEEPNPESKLILENTVADKKINFNIKCPPGFKVLSINPISIPQE